MKFSLSGESILWLATVVLVFASCGTSLVESGIRSVSGTARDEKPVFLLGIEGQAGATVGVRRKGPMPPETSLLCSGVLVAPRVVLTTASCLGSASSEEVGVYFGLATQPERRDVDVSLISRQSAADLAILTLSNDASPEYQPAALDDGTSSVAGGFHPSPRLQDLILSGYRVVGSTLREGHGLLRSVSLGSLQSQRGCSADGGAPLFAPNGVVVGLLSSMPSQNGPCPSVASFVDLKPHKSWLLAETSKTKMDRHTLRFRSAGGVSVAPSTEQINFDVPGFSVSVTPVDRKLAVTLESLDFEQTATGKTAPYCRLEVNMLHENRLAEAHGLSQALAATAWRSPIFQLGGQSRNVALTVSVPFEVKDLLGLGVHTTCQD